MAVRKLKPIEERDPYAAAVLDAFDRIGVGEQMPSEKPEVICVKARRNGLLALLRVVNDSETKAR